MKFEKITPGMILFDVRESSRRDRVCGHGRYAYWQVYVVSVDPEKRTARVRWNIVNPETTYSERQLSRLRNSPPGKKLQWNEDLQAYIYVDKEKKAKKS